MTDQIHSNNLVPFRKRRGAYHIPGMTGNSEEHALEVDQTLDQDEARFVRHYLGYADTLLKLDPVEAEEEVEPQKALEEVSLHKISLAEAAAGNKFTNAEFTGDEVHNAELTHDELSSAAFNTEQLDRESSTEAA